MLRKTLMTVTLLFVAAMVINTLIALHYKWPAMFDAPGDPRTIMRDFVWYGTRISPPVPGLLILTLSGILALHSGWRGVLATLLLVVLSILVTIAAAGEPAGLPPNDVPQVAWFVIGAIGRYAPILLITLGVAELIRRVTKARRGRNPAPSNESHGDG